MKTYLEVAEELVGSWRANDGGLTWAASDVLRFGAWLDLATPEQIAEIDYAALSAAEQDVLDTPIV